MSYLAFFLMVLHISTYSIICLLSPFFAISRRFVIRARVGDDVLDFCGLLIALATLDALSGVMSVMVSRMVSMSSRYCSVSNRFLNSSWNSIFYDCICHSLFPFYVHAQFNVAYSHSVVTSNVVVVQC